MALRVAVFDRKGQAGRFRDAGEASPEITRGLEQGGLLLPLLVISRRVCLQGFFDFRRLRDMVEAVGEAHG